MSGDPQTAQQKVLQLERNEPLFSLALENAPIGIALVGPDGRWLKVNRALCEMMGYSEAELLDGATFQDITHPDDLELDLEKTRQVIAGEIGTYEIEKRYLRADGRIVVAMLNVSLVRDGNGEPLCFISHIRDITAKKEAQAQQRAREARYLRQRNALISVSNKEGDGGDLEEIIRGLTETVASTLDVARVGVWRYNGDRTAIRCIDLYDAAAGSHHSGTELHVKDFPAYFEALKSTEVIRADKADDDPRTREFSENYSRPLGISSMLDAPIRFDGVTEGVLCHEHVGPPRCWTPDEETFAVAVANRISLALEALERQRIADELKRTLAKLEQMLAHSPAIIFRLKIVGDRFIPVSVSENLAATLGYSREEALAPNWWLDHLYPEDREVAFAGMRKLLQEGANRYEYRFCHKDGSFRWIEDNERVICNEVGEAVETVGVWMDITERKSAEASLFKINKDMIALSRQAGMADVATSVLHNVGNVLNSVNVSSTVLAERVKKSKTAVLAKTVALLREHESDLAGFLTEDPRGRKLPDFLAQIASHLALQDSLTLSELGQIQKNIDHIKEIVAMQQGFAKVYGTLETLGVQELVEDALRIDSGSLTRHQVEIVRRYDEAPVITVDKHKLLQVLVNLIRNGKDACLDHDVSPKRLVIGIDHDVSHVRISVTDNGVGIPPENLTRIFAHGFTTKRHGHGFGLHSSVLAVEDMGGSLTAHSEGPGAGATFVIELPKAQKAS